MPVSILSTVTSRQPGPVVLLSAVLLAVTLPGCIPPSTGSAQPGPEGVEPTVDLFASGYALPNQDGFEFYWYSQAPELHPLEEADVVLAGTVEAVSAVRETRGRAFDRMVSGWLTAADFRIICPVKGGRSREERVSITYFTPRETTYGGLSAGRGWWPETLGRGVSYVVLLRAPEFRVGERDDPPPIPLAVVDASACGQGSAPEIMTALLAASVRAVDTDLRGYAIPVLGYLAHFHGQESARGLLSELAESGEESVATGAFRALTAWGYADGDLELLTERSRDSSPTVSGAAIAGRIRRQDLTVFADLVAWCRRPQLPEHVVALIGRELVALPPQQLTEELIGQFGELLEREVPLDVRAGTAYHLSEVGTAEVVLLLIKAVNDPAPEVGYEAMVGLYSAVGGPEHPETRPFCVGPEEFRADPQRIAAFWNAWWETASQHGWPPKPEPERWSPPPQGPPPG